MSELKIYDSNLTAYEICQLRLKCAEIALIACTKLDVARDESLSFAETIWQFLEKKFVEKVQDKKKKETPA